MGERDFPKIGEIAQEAADEVARRFDQKGPLAKWGIRQIYTGDFVAKQVAVEEPFVYNEGSDWGSDNQGPIKNDYFGTVAGPELTELGKVIYAPAMLLSRMTVHSGLNELPIMPEVRDQIIENGMLPSKINKINSFARKNPDDVTKFSPKR